MYVYYTIFMLVGGIATPLKNMSSSVGMIFPFPQYIYICIYIYVYIYIWKIIKKYESQLG